MGVVLFYSVLFLGSLVGRIFNNKSIGALSIGKELVSQAHKSVFAQLKINRGGINMQPQSEERTYNLVEKRFEINPKKNSQIVLAALPIPFDLQSIPLSG